MYYSHSSSLVSLANETELQYLHVFLQYLIQRILYFIGENMEKLEPQKNICIVVIRSTLKVHISS